MRNELTPGSSAPDAEVLDPSEYKVAGEPETADSRSETEVDNWLELDSRDTSVDDGTYRITMEGDPQTKKARVLVARLIESVVGHTDIIEVDDGRLLEIYSHPFAALEAQKHSERRREMSSQIARAVDQMVAVVQTEDAPSSEAA